MEAKLMRQWTRRMRRMRRSAGVRDLVREYRVGVEDLVMPMFVKAGLSAPEPIEAMPGIFRYSPKETVGECRRLWELGIRAVALFPCVAPEVKDACGREALNADGLIPSVVRAVKGAVPEMTLIVDVALDPYTVHGHDGVLDAEGVEVDNDATVEILAGMAVVLARAGSDWVAPSDMMDGRVAAIRRALDADGLENTAILAYSAKFNSAFYGPFREAVGNGLAVGSAYLDKGAYQLDPANAREALRDALLDEAEGADLLMVKPAGPYLDVLARLREATAMPLAAYQVSGEYAQIHAAAKMGWLEYDRCRDESVLAIKRAGADLILSYFAKEMALALAKNKAGST